MYLFLVDYNFISSEQLQKMIEDILPGADIVNCFSAGTLIKVADKLMPDVMILDYDLIGENHEELLGELRTRNKQAHVLALIEPGSYDDLYRAIEDDLIDDYVIKPVNNDEFAARIYIATRRKSLDTGEEKEANQVEETAWDKGHLPDYKEETLDEKVEEIEEEGEESVLFYERLDDDLETTVFKDEKEEPGGGRELEEEPAADESVDEEMTEDDELWTGKYTADASGNLDELNEDEAEPAGEEEPESGEPFTDEKETGDSFSDGSASQEGPESKEYDDFFTLDDEEEMTLADSTAEDEFIFKESTDELKNKSEETKIDDSGAEIAEHDEDLFAESFNEKVDEEGDFTELFKTTEEPGREEENLFGEEEKDFSEDIDFGEVAPDEKIIKPDTTGGPAVFKPFTEEERESGHEAPGFFEEEAEEKYFDDLFSEETAEFQKDSIDELFEEEPKAAESTEEPEPGEEDSEQEMPRREISLPGESADDFLYGENETVESLFAEDDEEATDSSEEEPKKKALNREKTSGSGFSRFLNTLGNVIFVVILLMMAVLSFFLIQSKISGGAPKIAGYQVYIVLSGSMRPEFDTGSIAFVREVPVEEVTVGDIITFRSQFNEDSLTTHRVVNVESNGDLKFITRGDANDVNDPNPVSAGQVVGRVTGSVPYVGYLLDFVQTRQGLILLIFIPGVLIIIYELTRIIRYVMAGQQEKTEEKTV